MKKFLTLFSTLLLMATLSAQTYLTETFDDATFPPTGWAQQQISGVGLWDRQTSGTFPTCSPQSGAGMVRYNCYSFSAGVSAALISAPVNLTTATSPAVEFWMYRDAGYSTNADRVDVLINTSPTNTGATLLGSIHRSKTLAPVVTTADGWYKYVIAIPTHFNTAVNHIIIRGTSGYGNNIFVDELIVRDGVSVPAAPTAFFVSNETVSSLQVNWLDNSDNETSFRVYMATEMAGPYSLVGTVASTTTATTGAAYFHTLTGLLDNTTYYFRITAVFDGESPFITGSGTTLAGTIIGNKTVGPSGDYASLTAAFSAINSQGLAGPVNLILEEGYVSTVETFPIVPSSIATATKTITIYPAVAGLSITSNNATTTFNFVGTRYVTIDGRVNASGTTPSLTIENTSTAGSAIQFVSDAVYNTIQYCNIKGVYAAATVAKGVINFGNTTGTLGNSNNTIQYNAITSGTTLSNSLIYSLGSAAAPNTNNVVQNNNFYDFGHASALSSAINLSTGSTSWNILNNSFYQTVSRTTTSAAHSVYIANIGGSNFNIVGNYFGGTEPMCGGTPMTYTNANPLLPIFLSAGVAQKSTIADNVYKNVALTASGTSTSFGAIRVLNGRYDIKNNIIGDETTTAISVTMSGSGALFAPIVVGTGTTGNDEVLIEGNLISGISFAVTGTPATVPHFRGISAQTGGPTANHSVTIRGNTIKNITYNANSTLLGIISFAGSSTQVVPVDVSGNTITGITNTNTDTAASIVAFHLQGSGTSPYFGLYNVRNNVVSNITNAGGGPTHGMRHLPTQNGGVNIESNRFFNISNTHATANVSVAAIWGQFPTVGVNRIHRNFIYDLNAVSTGATALIDGMNVQGGAYIVQNNMIALGQNVTAGIQINGINQLLGTGVRFYHNTVYVGGTATAGAFNTFAFNRNQTGALAEVYNNIFVNERTGGTGKHYAMKISADTDYTASWLASNYNILKNAVGENLMAVGTTDYNFATWQSTTGFDTNSLSVDPLLAAPTAVVPDLHLTLGSPAEGVGIEIASVVDDFDGELRSDFTPVDIGADAGNYDNTPPTIVSFVPANGATDVAVGSNIVVTFSEPVRKLDDTPIDASVVSFKKVSDNSDVLFSTNYINKVLTILPNAALIGLTQYSVTISGVEDTNHNLLVGANSITFTTGNDDFTAPTIVNAVVHNSAPSVIVVNFSENVKLTNTNGITVTVNGAERNITGYTGSGTSALGFTLESPVQSHDAVLLTYNSATGTITDIADNPLASVTDLVVTNNVLSSQKDILTFVIEASNNASAGVTENIIGTIGANTVTFLVSTTVNLTALVPTITVSNWATISPASGVAQNFTSPVQYTVTAEDGTTKTYTVTAKIIYSLPFAESFNGATIPSGWTEINSAGVTPRWTISTTTFAGGSPNEIRCAFQNINPAITRFVTPPINTAGVGVLKLSFRHFLNAYGAGATLKVLSSTDLINWTQEWAVPTTATDIPATLVNLTITNNLGNITYFAFAVEGNLFQIDYWYIDDVVVRTPSSNSLLSQLTVNGVPISGFSPNVFSYNYDVPQGTPVPVVGATVADPHATLVITQATSVPGTASVVVTSEDGTSTSTYTVNYLEVPAFNVTFTVKDFSNNAIQGAVINIGGQNYTTASDGTAMVILGAGTYSYTITAANYVAYSGEVTVINQHLSVPVQLQDVIVEPFGLKVAVSGNTANFSWNNPPFSFIDDFESYPNFSVDNFGPYTFIDIDQRPTYTVSGATFPNQGYTGTAIVFNPSAATPPLTAASWQPRSGQKYLAIFDAIPAGTITANNDWVISQQVLAEPGMTFSFWAKSITSTYGLERIRVLVSTTGTAPTDFTLISSGSYLQVPTAWTQYSYNLSLYAGMNIYVAIQCVSADAYALFIDDLSITINKQSASKAFLGYNVYLNGTLVANNVQGTSYQFTNVPAGDHIAGVQAVYSSGVSAIVTKSFTIQPSAYPVTFTVVDDQGAPLSGVTVSAGGQQAETNSSGVAVLELANGNYSYTISKLGYITVTGNIVVNFAPVSVNATMLPAQFTVTFVVKHAQTNAAIPAASIVINPGNLVSLTNASGIANRNLYNGEYTFKVIKSGFVTYEGSFTVHNANLNIAVNLEPVVGIDEVEGGVLIYPNPVSNILTIERNSATETVVELYNNKGAVVNSFTTTDATLILDVSNLPSGAYFIRMISESGTSVHRVVKE